MRPLIVSLLFAAAASGADTLTLRQALDAAARMNPDTQSARLRMLEAEALRQQTASAYKPQATVAIAGSYQTNNLQGIGLIFPGFPSRLGPYRVFNARPVVTQAVIDLPLLSSIRAARERYEQSKQEIEVVRETTQLAVLQLYLQALQDSSRREAAEARLKTAQEALTQTTDREQAGSSSKLDVARAEQQFQTEKANAIEAQRDFAIRKTLLLRTIGESEPREVDLEPLPAVVPAPAPALGETLGIALDSRAELRSLDAQARAARYEEQKARRERYAKLSFSGDYGVLGQGPDKSLSTFDVGASLTIPILTGGRIQAEIKGARARSRQIDEQTRKTRLAITQEVRQSLLEMDAAREALAAAQEATRAARESLELSRLRFSSGLSTNLDVVNAQSALALADDFEIRTRYDYLLAKARLARARGNVNLFFDPI